LRARLTLKSRNLDVYSQKSVEALIQENCYGYWCFNVFGFIEALDLKRILNKLTIDGMH